MRILLNTQNVEIKHARTTSGDRITGLVDETELLWSTGYNYRLKPENGESFLAELVDVDVHGDKQRLTFEK